MDNTSAFQRNARQALYEKQKSTTCASRTGTKKTKDVLASVLELQKEACKGSIHDVVCNDLLTIVLFNEKQIYDIIKFCCHQQTGMVPELDADISFQLGTFFYSLKLARTLF